MALSEFEIKKCEKAIESFMAKRRPPAHIRKEVDLSYRINNQSIEIFEIRPRWDNPSEIIEIPIAKSTYVKTKNKWSLFWQRADATWHKYEPEPHVKTVDEFLNIVAEDQYACFFG